MKNKALSDLTASERHSLLKLAHEAKLNRIGKSQKRAPINRADRSQALPLSLSQQRLWFIDQLEGDGTAYHIPGAVRLRGVLDWAALRATLDTIVERHEVLRTVFKSVEGTPVQEISGVAKFALQELDLSEQAVEEREAEIARQAVKEASAPFDLSKGPLIRGRLIRLGTEEQVLLLTMHHIVSDGWSMGIWVREIATLYGAYCAGRSNPLAPLAIQYADYAVWQRGWLQGEVLQAQVKYWQEQLQGASALLELPTDRPRPRVQSHRGDSVGIVLSAELSGQLKALARKHDATLFMVLYSGFAILLSRLSGQEDVVIGTAVANRQRSEVEGLIGFFVNTLAMRARLSDGLSVSALLKQVKEMTLGAYSHQEIPFEQVVEVVQPPRSLSHSPVFQVMLALQNMPQSELRLPGLTLAPQAVSNSTEKFDLTLSLQEVGGQIVGGLSYASDLFDRATIERWAGHFQTVLAEMVRDAEQQIGVLPLLGSSERHQLIEGFNATAAAYPQDKLIHGLFEEQVEKTPDAIAVVYEEQQLTYGELNERANRLAHYLRKQGVGPDQLVALCVERSVEMIVGLLGILKAGGAYVPLDPSYPQDRLAYMLEDAAPRVVLTQERLRDLLPQTSASVIALDSEWSEIVKSPGENLARRGLTPKHLAYVIYTSGSTGQPKGVMVEHCGLCNLARAQIQAFEVQSESRVLQFASLSFDACVSEIMTTLCCGASLQLASREALMPGEPLLAMLRARAITHVTLPPAAVSALPFGEGLETLSTLIVAGEACSSGLAERWAKRLRFINAYGPTEATVCASMYVCDSQNIGAPPIGRPISNTQIYVLDSHGQPVPMGVNGEIYIGGSGVARGYLNKEALTAERFVKDPYSQEASARLYKTGDIGRWRADGNLEYVGRNDHQVKIRGFRIELGEIEAQLCRHAQVKEAVVIAREDRPGEKRLVAYLTPAEGMSGALSTEGLRAHLKEVLPEYMIPSAYVRLEQLPLTPNGKLDRNALPVPELEAYAVQAYEAPQGEIEEALAGIWRELLSVERVGRHDNFFELGGHSLLIMQLIERLRRVGLSVELRAVFTSPTLTALASTLRSEMVLEFVVPPNLIPVDCVAITPEMLTLVQLTAEEIEHIVHTVPGGAANVQDIYPLVPLQEGILFHHLLHEQSDPYVSPVLLAVESRARLDALLNTLQAVINRHDILRSAVLWRELSRAVQVVYRHASLPVQEIELDAAQDLLEQLKARMVPEKQRMELQQAPLIRVQIASDTHSSQWYVLLQQHHIISDHVGQEIVLSEVLAQLTGQVELLAEPVAYRGFVAQAMAYAERNDAETYFRAKLGTMDEPTAPFGLLDVQGDGSEIVESQQILEASLARRVRACARQLRISTATLFHVAWAFVVAKTSGRDDVVFGSVLSGRLQGTIGADRVLGMFINTLPLRLQLKGLSVRQLVFHTQQELVELLKYEQASLAVAQRCSGMGSGATLFSAVLNYRHSTSNIPSAGEVNDHSFGIQVLAAQERTSYPFAVSVDDLGEDFTITAQVDRRLKASRVTAYVHEALESLIQALESAPETEALTLGVLPQAERRQLLEEFNATRVEYPKDTLIQELFEAQVEKTPDAVAVVYEEQQLTYQQLNQRANQVAHYLRKQGVGPDQLVALCVERSVEMIVGLLGILKAGGAYVPLDPSYPQDRLAYMLEDAAPRVVLTQERLRDLLPQTSASVIALDSEWSEIVKSPGENLARRGLTPKHLAYVIYTSGSTGQPKGVMVEHCGLCNLARAQIQAFEVQSESRVLQFASLSFDACVSEIMTTLCCGASLQLASREALMPGEPLLAMLRARAITHVTLPPAAVSALPFGEGLETLSTLIVAGEACSSGLAERWAKRLRFINAYGPTEATVCASMYVCDSQNIGAPPIGRPISNTQIYVLDSHGQPVPMGVNGEIYIGGSGVARGYLNKEALTAERFVKDPYSQEASARLYKTGDIGRWRADGNLEYVGRNDHQVKIRGFRIELGEIEAQLCRHAQVKEAVVIAREDRPGEKRLVAYLTPAEGMSGALSTEGLRAHLKEVLPEYMIPSAYVRLEQLPLTPNGKLDRNALPAPELEAYAVQAYEAPQGEIEEALAGIWRELLSVERVGRHDNFFELGGHSLLIVQLLERLRRIGINTAVRSVFEHSTLAALADRLNGPGIETVKIPPNLISVGCEAITPEMVTLVELTQEEIDRIVQTVAGGAKNVQDIYPLAPLQEGILFHHLLSEQGDAYVTPMLLSVESRAQLDALLQALQAVNDRHDILRSAVLWEGLPQPVQVVYRHAPLPVEEIELDADQDAVEQMRARMAPQWLRMDIRYAPLVRVQIARDVHSMQWYVLLLQHHLIVDHVGLEIMQSEFMAHLEGRTEHLAQPLAYREFVGRALAQVQAQGSEAEAFFRSKLGTIDEPTAPFGLLNVHGDGSEIAEARQEVASELAQRIRQHARRLGMSAATLFHAAWALVIARTSGRDEVVFGSVLSGRLQGGVGIDRVLGMFINTLPLRVQLQGHSAEQLVRQMQREIVELLQHEQTSLAIAQRCSGISGGAPLFSAVLNYRHSTPMRRSDGDEHPNNFGIRVLGGQERTNYPFTVSVDDVGEGFAITAQTERRIAPERVIEYVQTAMASLVEALERAPETSALQLQVLSASERHQLIEGFNATKVAYPKDKLIHELFEEQVEKTPDAIAVVYEEQRLTYGELNRRANQLAHYLKQQGVCPDQLVAICVERSVEMIVGLLGILKAGGAYVPLDPSYPAERLEYMLRDAVPRVLLTQERLRDLLPQTSASVIALDSEWSEIAKQADSNFSASALGVTANHLAYVIYTSGSTGQPKGVAIEHRNTTNLIFWAHASLSHKAFNDTLFSTSLNFDLAVYECFVPLTLGGRIRLVNNALDLASHPVVVTHINTVPSVIKALFDTSEIPATTQIVNLAGEALKKDLVERIFAASKVDMVCNLYGPSETTTYSTWIQMRREEGFVETIGRPISNTQIYVLDSHGQPVPMGVNGEIYIGGSGVARGYLNKEALTAERFVKDPYSQEASARLYKTGDIGRWRADGNLEYVGRNDHQVKIRGFRIELGEIEAQLCRHAQVKEAVVIAREDRRGEKRLVAYLTPTEGMSGALSTEGLRAHLKEVLPEYMIPSAYVRLEQLPLTPNGKLDRNALPAPELEAYAVQAYEAPQGEIEEALAGIWRELLSVERVGRHDNFFELGGHSLLAMQLLGRIRTVMKIEVPLRTLFEYPVLQELQKQLATQTLVTLMPIERADRNQALPLSWSQQRLWFIAQLEGAGEAYHIPGAVRLQGVLDRAALQHALDTLVERHEVLRTCFMQAEGRAVQVIAEEGTFALQVIDLSQSPPAEREAAVQRHVVEEARAPFEMSTGPLIRGRLLRVAEQEHVLLITMHHIVSDGWSLGIFIREVGVLYSAYREGRSNPLAALPIQYADYAQWQRQWLVGDRLQEQLTYWQRQLSGAPALLELPTDRPRPAVQRYAGGSVEFALGTTLSGQLKAFSRQQEVTLFMTVYAGFALLLSRLSGQDDIVMGTAMANRQRPEVEELIGFFVNTLALRVRLSDTLTVRELLNEVREMTLRGYSHQEAPFEQVVEAVRPPRSLSHSPIFQVMLALQNTPQSEVQLPGLSLAPQAMAQTTAQYDLSLSLQEIGDELVGSFNYASDLFDRETIERWSHSFKAVLEGMLRDVEQAVGVIPLLSEGERYQLIEGFNATRVAYPKDTLIQELFEAQVEQTPDAVAVVYEEQQLTYQQLNQRANQVAHYLRKQGVGPDQLVAICVERSVEMIVGLLGILKAGGAYVPLDPSYPQDRLAYMLEDAAPRVVLTQERLRDLLPQTSASVIALDSEWSEISKSPGEDLSRRGLTSNHLAYVIYTSGSTGQPKGVMVEHSNVVRLFSSTEELFQFNDHDVWTLFHSFAFDFSVWEIWGALLYGGKLIVVPYLVSRSPQSFYELLCKEHVTVLNQTPSAFTQLMAAQAEHSMLGKVTNTHALRWVVFGGEALELRTLEPWVARNGLQQPRLMNMYGITETTVHVTHRELTQEDIDSTSSSVVGRPLGDLRAYLLDRYQQPVPIGVSGELYIGGAGVARGYLNKEALTAERFVKDPFSKEASARLYKTGDIGRWRADGNLEYVGRNDHQVKIRGFRIELGEIEAQLCRHAQVKEAVVIAREDRPGEKRLVAYLTVLEDALSVEALRVYLKGTLPEYMIPSAFVQLAQLPLTPNGKLDRKALPAPELEAYAVQAYEAPQGEIEEALAGIWRELLSVERVGRHDNFFELGGHSLLMLELISRLQNRGFNVKLQAMFEYPTIMMLGAYLKNGTDIQSTNDNLITLKRGGSSRPLFLIHPIGGAVFPYIPLARLLHDSVPVHALQMTEMNNSPSIQQLATKYSEIIQRTQSHGPYRLAGWSMGALVAHEMAYQLLNMGKSVEFVGLIDGVIHIAPPPDTQQSNERSDVSILLSALEVIAPTIDQAALLELKGLDEVPLILERCKQMGILPMTLSQQDLQARLEYHRALEDACASYSPRRLPILLHFFVAKNELPLHLSRDPALFAGDKALEIVIGGTHEAMMDSPYVERLADAINKALGECEESQFSGA